MAMAHTAMEATRRPVITSLTTKSALRNKSEIESGAAEGIAPPSARSTLPRLRLPGGLIPAREERKTRPIRPPKTEIARKSVRPICRGTEFPAKHVQTRARVAHARAALQAAARVTIRLSAPWVMRRVPAPSAWQDAEPWGSVARDRRIRRRR